MGAMILMPCSPFFDIMGKLISPFIKANHKGGIGLLHGYKQGVVEGIAVKMGHGSGVLHIFLAFKQFFDAAFYAGGYLF